MGSSPIDETTRPSRRARSVVARVVFVALTIVLAVFGASESASAQDHGTVIRVLEASRDFRARTRAASALGASADPRVAPVLARALDDRHAAVRAAAADGLGRVGDAASVTALRAHLADGSVEVRDASRRAITAIEARRAAATTARATAAPTAGPATASAATTPTAPATPTSTPTAPSAAAGTVPSAVPPAPPIDWGHARYVVVVGTMDDRSGFAHAPLTAVLRQEVMRQLATLRGVAVVTEASLGSLESEIRRRRLRRYRLEGSIQAVQPEAMRHDVRVRCQVSMMLMDDPGRNIRAALQGAATGTEPRGRGAPVTQQQHLAERALLGAVRSAMTGTARALAAQR